MRPLTVSLPAPCAESWAAMTPAGAGRHCAACQQLVVDFTHKTDAELLAYFRQAAGQPTCGRLRPDQLHRALHPAAPVSRWRAWLASALALGGVLGAGRAAAQSHRSHYAGPLPEAVSPVSGARTTPAADPVAATGVPGPAAGPGAEITVHGLVLDRENKVGLPGVSVLLRGTAIGTSTNAEGQFSLTLPAGAAARQLSFQFIGYHPQELALPRDGQPMTVRLAPDYDATMGIVVTASRYHPWHPRTLYYRVSRLLGR